MCRNAENGPPERAWRRLCGIVVVALLPMAAWPDAAGAVRQIEAIAMAWRLVQATDAATGRRSCAVVSLGGDVTARLVEAGPGPATWTVVVGFGNQPGSLRYLRVDKAIYTTAESEFEGREAGDIVARLAKAVEFAFEWAARPDYRKRQGLFGTGDFAARAAACEDWIDGTPT